MTSCYGRWAVKMRTSLICQWTWSRTPPSHTVSGSVRRGLTSLIWPAASTWNWLKWFCFCVSSLQGLQQHRDVMQWIQILLWAVSQQTGSPKKVRRHCQLTGLVCPVLHHREPFMLQLEQVDAGFAFLDIYDVLSCMSSITSLKV